MGTLREAVERAEKNFALKPRDVRIARANYWSHLALADAFASSTRFSLGRIPEAEQHYRRSEKLAQALVTADPHNQTAMLDLARVYGKHGAAIEGKRPVAGLALIQRALALTVQQQPRNQTWLDLHLLHLTQSVRPLLRLARYDEANIHVRQARVLWREMRRLGIPTSENAVLRAEATRLAYLGLPHQALATARRELTLYPKTADSLGGNFQAIELLERMRTYATGVDSTACREVTQRLANIWRDLRLMYPSSDFVRTHADRIRTLRCPVGTRPTEREAWDIRRAN